MTDNFPAFAKLVAASFQDMVKNAYVFVSGMDVDALGLVPVRERMMIGFMIGYIFGTVVVVQVLFLLAWWKNRP